MTTTTLFVNNAQDFSGAIASFRGVAELDGLRNIAQCLHTARRALHTGVTKLGAKASQLTVTNYVEFEIDNSKMEYSLHSKLSTTYKHRVDELPVHVELGHVFHEEFFRHICIESYRIAKGDEDKYYTGEELQDRFTEQLNGMLPKGCCLGLSGIISRPYTPYVSFKLKLTDVMGN